MVENEDREVESVRQMAKSKAKAKRNERRKARSGRRQMRDDERVKEGIISGRRGSDRNRRLKEVTFSRKERRLN